MTTRSAVTALAASAALLVGPAATAQAYTQGPIKSRCEGRLLDAKDLRDNGRRIGRVELYYSPQAGGQNCSITYNYLPGRVYTQTFLGVDDDGDKNAETGGERQSIDHDLYERYAGASYRNRTNGKCVRYGGVVSGRGYYKAWVSKYRWCG